MFYRLVRLLSFNLPTFFIFQIANLTLSRSQLNGVYAADSDSIAIPIYTMMLVFIILSLPLTLLALIPQSSWTSKLIVKCQFGKFFVAIPIFGMYAIGIIFALGGILENLDANNYPIGLAHVPLLAVLNWYLRDDYKWLKNKIINTNNNH